MTRQFMSMAEKRRFEWAQKQKQQRFTGRKDWSDDEIKNHFDTNPNVTIQQLAFMTGKTSGEIKRILMED